MRKSTFRHPLVAALLLVSMLCQGTWVLAGTTGGLNGTVFEAGTTTPVANAKVSVTSASQNSSATTDATGHFTFVSLAPDTYTVSAEKQGYDSNSQSGITVTADQTRNLDLTVHRSLKEIGRVTSRSSTDLVKPGTTTDVYTVNAAQQTAVAALGGGGGLNNSYSAIASVPGVYVPIGQGGWFQTVHIRGGDYDQVGYELDGVPVNRSFDNYPSGAASSLGQQELQVYTGAVPTSSEGQGLAGYINQVIRTGTYPGYGTVTAGLGGPSFYHKLTLEAAGASPNRNFSYYLGSGGYNQEFRSINNANGAGDFDNFFGTPIDITACPTTPDPNLASCYAITQNGNQGSGAAGPGGIITAPFSYATAQSLSVRNTVANLHFGLPHRSDSGKDDIQLLFINDKIDTSFRSSPNDLGPALTAAQTNGVALAGTVPYYVDGYYYNGPLGSPLPANYQALTTPYLFPSSPSQRLANLPAGTINSPIDPNHRDTQENSQSIFKLQYQKNFGSSAYFRIYGYTYYSTYISNSPVVTGYLQALQGAGIGSALTFENPRDYELTSHTRGVSASFADQINSKNLLNLQTSYTTASTIRDNNGTSRNASGRRGRFAALVDPTAPLNGICYRVVKGTTAAIPTTCDPTASPALNRATYATLAQAFSGTVKDFSGNTCGGGPCEFLALESGASGTFNNVKPVFTAYSITDQFKPSDRLLLNFGLRYDNFQFKGGDTSATPARTKFFNSFNQTNCQGPNGPFDKTSMINPSTGNAFTALDPCSLVGTQLGIPNLVAANLINPPGAVQTYSEVQPRIGFTYTLNPDTVLRGSYGVYASPPNSAFEQYNSLGQNIPVDVAGFGKFLGFGFNSTSHAVRPQVAYNTDLSLEKHLKGTDTSFKLTPFLRKTRDQIQIFFLDQPAGFVSGLNVGRLTAEGLEFQVQKGDFARDGFAGQLSFTYTNTYNQFTTLPNGGTVVSGINADIQHYNGYTKACATGNAALCGSTNPSPNAVACFAPSGAPDPGCASAGAVANPYFNQTAQPIIDPKGNFVPFSLVTGGIGSASSSFEVPYVASLVLQYKKQRWTVTPSLQFQAGNRYGMPESTPGVDPASGCNPLKGTTVNDPRYPAGAAGGAPYDALTCQNQLTIPNLYTRQFDQIGAFRQPSQIVGNLQIGYKASDHVALQLTAANVFNSCFGGTKAAWTNSAPGGSCSFGLNAAGGLQTVGNIYNPGVNFQRVVQYPYNPYPGPFNTNTSFSNKLPFSLYLEAKVRI